MAIKDVSVTVNLHARDLAPVFRVYNADGHELCCIPVNMSGGPTDLSDVKAKLTPGDYHYVITQSERDPTPLATGILNIQS